MLNYVLIIILLGAGGSSPRPATAIEAVNFTSKTACEAAATQLMNKELPKLTRYGPDFKIIATCVKR